MTKTYYRNEYTEKQWEALIDAAIDMNCQITYSKYGTCVEIDSTQLETAILQSTNRDINDNVARQVWAESIHGRLQEVTDIRTWKVHPKRYHRGYCATLCKSKRQAEHEQMRLERMTGFEWTITIIAE